ncbi:type II toxin-antitoxin system HipA family toxin [Testudinibacter sp. P80/BLE/0925]|uniref:type II toxin-antitoxin system HipA family toxin n=1 Tax=Testudinibacter sp. TW-1 TaxID=3417757 RepID=UPI003D364E60
MSKVQALNLHLHGTQIGVLLNYAGNHNRLIFAPEYQLLPAEKQPLITLAQRLRPDYFTSNVSHLYHHRMTPLLSNLLPEGILRDWIAQSLKIPPENEFPLLAQLGENLPGALVATPLTHELPQWAKIGTQQPEQIELQTQHQQKFSLAGVQMKFSGHKQDKRFYLNQLHGEDDWIIKTPFSLRRTVPQNEYSMMKLAELAGVVIPEIQLIALTDLDGLPEIALAQNEEYAYAIKRFDRTLLAHKPQRIHSEDFAQIFELYPHNKYNKINYEQIGAVIYRYAEQGLAELQQMARRLLVNILLANGDAHIKNWSLFYPERQVRLAPAYDIVCTLPYIAQEAQIALNLGKEKNWYQLNFSHFEQWTKRIGAPWQAIQVHLRDVLQLARQQWRNQLVHLPMDEQHKVVLQRHWKNLHPDFRLD